MTRSLAAAGVLLALLACGGEVKQAERDEARAKCEKEVGFDKVASESALAKLKSEGCKDKSLLEGCADWWNHTVIACVYQREGAREIEVHSDLFAETDTHREHREGMCDGVRRAVSMTDRAVVINSQGKRMTTCGRPRR